MPPLAVSRSCKSQAAQGKNTRMSSPQLAPFGSWRSPITSDLIVVGHRWPGAGRRWTATTSTGSKTRPAEGGRYVMVRRTPDGQTTDRTRRPSTSAPASTSTAAAPTRSADGTVYFSNFADQRLYRQEPARRRGRSRRRRDCATPTASSTRRRPLDLRARGPHRRRQVGQPVVSVAMHGGDAGEVLAPGNDFYADAASQPGRPAPGLARLEPSRTCPGTAPSSGSRELSEDGMRGSEASASPAAATSRSFSRSGRPTACCISSPTARGWWNLYRWRDGQLEPLCADGGGVRPAAVGLRLIRPTPSRRRHDHAVRYTQRGTWHLASARHGSGHVWTPIETPYTDVARPPCRPATRPSSSAARPPTPLAVVATRPRHRQRCEVLRRSSTRRASTPAISPFREAIEFPTESGLTAHAFFYPPRNRDFTRPAGERPPLLVISHGGPTARRRPRRSAWRSSTGPAAASPCST